MSFPVLSEVFFCHGRQFCEYTLMQFLRAVSHSIMHVQPLQIQDGSDDESDPADHAADEDTANVDFHRLVGHV